MKLTKSTIEKPINEMVKGKCSLSCDGEVENIWVAKDEESGKMFLLNHAVCIFPLPSWGTELPLGDSFDITEMRGPGFDDTKLTLHKEAFDYLNEKGMIKEDGELDITKYFAWQAEISNSKQEENNEENKENND